MEENTTSALADPSDVEAAHELLGALLLTRGLITPTQLEAALAEQASSGAQLGSIIVARGFTSAASVAQALATQYGGLLKTEYGFATGFGTGVSRSGTVADPPVSPVSARPRATADVARSATGVAIASAAAAPDAVDSERDGASAARHVADLEAQVAELTAGAFAWERTYAALKEELEQLRASFAAGETDRDELERRLTAEVARNAALRVKAAEEQRASAEASKSARAELEARLAQVTARAEAVEADVAAAAERLEQAQSARADLERQKTVAAKLQETALASERARVELEQRLAALETELAERQAATPAAASEEAGPWAGADAHLLFFQGRAGYELVEKQGPPPAAGTFVDGRLVARVASGAFPAALPCVYLVA